MGCQARGAFEGAPDEVAGHGADAGSVQEAVLGDFGVDYVIAAGPICVDRHVVAPVEQGCDLVQDERGGEGGKGCDDEGDSHERSDGRVRSRADVSRMRSISSITSSAVSPVMHRGSWQASRTDGV